MLLKKRLFKSTLSVLLVLLLTISCLPITVSAASAEVVDIDVEPITIVEYTNGYYTTSYNKETEDWDLEYYCYQPEYIVRPTITFSDGTVVECIDTWFEYNSEDYSYDYETEQNYYSRWVAGNTYKMTISVFGYSVEVPVTIVETPIESIEVQPITVIENVDGYYDWGYNHETKHWDLEYFKYSPDSKLDYTITFKDGTIIAGCGRWFDYNDEECSFTVTTDQDYDNQWTVGNTYTMTASVMGYSVEVPVTVAPSPIESIEVYPISIMEFTNGYPAAEYDSNDELIGEYYHYHPEEIMEYEVTFKDGTVIYDYSSWFEHDDTIYNFDIQTNQSYNNQWTAGNTYTMRVSLSGCTVNVPVTITAPPVKKLEIEPVTLIELTDGFNTSEYNPETGYYDLSYFYYDLEDIIEYTVTLNDDTTISSSGLYVDINGMDSWIDLYTEQSYENQWKPNNTYVVEANLMGVSTKFEVTIAETPIKDIIIEPLTVYREVDSYISTEYNPETDEFDLEYDYYTYEDNIEYTVNFKDGTKVSYQGTDDIEYNNNYYDVFTYDNQAYETPWTTGKTYNATMNVLGVTVDFPVTVEESPVKSVEFIKATDKTNYVPGEAFDFRGSVIRINYTDNTYEDIEIDKFICSYYGIPNDLYVKRFNRYFTPNTEPFFADINSTSAKIKILGKEATTNISVANKSIESVTISGSGIDLKMEITYSDKTKQTANVLGFDTRYNASTGVNLINGGYIVTDIGIFNGRVLENRKTSNFCFELILTIPSSDNNYTSNKISSNYISANECDWWKFNKKLKSVAFAIASQVENITGYNGKVTAENIDELLSIACTATDLRYNEENFTDITVDSVVFYADKVEAAFLDIFGFKPDLTLSDNYNSQTNTIEVKTNGIGGPGFIQPPEIKQSGNSIDVKLEWHSYYNLDNTSISFDKNLNLTSFSYSASGETILSGDVNNDGIINVVDATEIQKYLAGIVKFNDTQIISADFNGDSTVSIIDATNIQKRLAGLI